MDTNALPARAELLRAFDSRDRRYEGIFFTAVRTTGIFCRPTCTAKKPRPENVELYASALDALSAGYRACKRCRPMDADGAAPAWLAPLLDDVERDRDRRYTDDDLRALGLAPERVRRWFLASHGMTFHAYARARRLGRALGRIRLGESPTRAALDHGYGSLSGFRDAFARQFGEPPTRAGAKSQVVVTRLLTPLGPMVAAATERAVCLLDFADRRMLETQLRRIQRRLACTIAPGDSPVLAQLDEELRAYFAGTRTRFDVPLQTPGSDFQLAVWRALAAIPFGETTSYDAIAKSIGSRSARRAVGRANGDNPIAILVPCHRVIGADGTLTGYGGGLRRKEWLLAHERRVLQRAPSRTTTRA